MFNTFVFYLLWRFVIRPWKIQRFYRKYKNVDVPKSLNYPSGDLVEIYKCIDNGRFTFQYLTDTDAAKYDIRLGHFGELIQFEIISPKACDELDKLIPDKIDRYDGKFGIQFVRVFGNTVALKRSDDYYLKVRNTFTKLFGFNHASSYIPIIIDIISEQVDSWKTGQTIDGLSEMCNVVLKIIVRIIFGKDINDEIEYLNYTRIDGKVVKMDFYQFFPLLMKDLLDAEIHYINIVFPVLFKNGW